MERSLDSDAQQKVYDPPKLFTKNFVSACISASLYNAGHSMGYAVLPLLLHHMQASGTVIGLITTLNVVAGMVLRPFLGNLSDRFSKRIVLLCGLSVVLVCFAGIGIASVGTSVALLVLLRTIQGAGAAAVTTANRSIVAEIAPREKLVDAVSYNGTISAIFSGIAPGIALMLIAGNRFRKGFFEISVIIALAMLVLLFLNYEKEPWFQNRKQRIANERKNTVSISGGLFEKSAVPATLIIFLINLAVSSATSFLVLYASQRGLADIGLYYTIASVGSILVRLGIIPLRKKVSDGTILFAAFAMLALNYYIIAQMHSLYLLLFSGLLNGFGTGIYSSLLEAAALKNTAPERYGVASSTMLIGIDMGIIVGSAVWGVISDMYGYKTVFLLATAAIIFCAFFSLVVLKNMRRKTYNI